VLEAQQMIELRQEFSLHGQEYILLCDLLKVINLCKSGGQAKRVISEGAVKVNGEVELRKRCKIRAESLVEFTEQEIKVTA
jgi:ribosome-associated protein